MLTDGGLLRANVDAIVSEPGPREGVSEGGCGSALVQRRWGTSLHLSSGGHVPQPRTLAPPALTRRKTAQLAGSEDANGFTRREVGRDVLRRTTRAGDQALAPARADVKQIPAKPTGVKESGCPESPPLAAGVPGAGWPTLGHHAPLTMAEGQTDTTGAGLSDPRAPADPTPDTSGFSADPQPVWNGSRPELGEGAAGKPSSPPPPPPLSSIIKVGTHSPRSQQPHPHPHYIALWSQIPTPPQISWALQCDCYYLCVPRSTLSTTRPASSRSAPRGTSERERRGERAAAGASANAASPNM